MAGPQPELAQPSDPWFARLAFHVLRTHGPWWVTAWLVLVLAALVGLGIVAGPWVPSSIAAVSGIAGVGTAIVKARASRPAATPPDPALDPPPLHPPRVVEAKEAQDPVERTVGETSASP